MKRSSPIWSTGATDVPPDVRFGLTPLRRAASVRWRSVFQDEAVRND
jgi:hypothetical protein